MRKPSGEKRAPIVIEVVENKSEKPRKSSMMMAPSPRNIRKRSVTILPPEGIHEEDSSSDTEEGERHIFSLVSET